MRTLRRVFGVATMLALVVAMFVWLEHVMSQPDTKGFDPQEMGRLESAMWRSYYEGQWVRLACQTMRAEAMAYRDARGGKITEAEWQEITRQLHNAYTSLKQSLT